MAPGESSRTAGPWRFRAISSGTSSVLFTLPASMRPAAPVYVAIDLCSSAVGRLVIQPDGTVSVSAASFPAAQCFTSLDGAWFAQ